MFTDAQSTTNPMPNLYQNKINCAIVIASHQNSDDIQVSGTATFVVFVPSHAQKPGLVGHQKIAMKKFIVLDDVWHRTSFQSDRLREHFAQWIVTSSCSLHRKDGRISSKAVRVARPPGSAWNRCPGLARCSVATVSFILTCLWI